LAKSYDEVEAYEEEVDKLNLIVEDFEYKLDNGAKEIQGLKLENDQMKAQII
jgi:hypothetical protein